MGTFVRRTLPAVTAAALLVGTPLVADARTEPVVSAPIATGLAGPLQIAVQSGRTVLVSQSFAGLLTRHSDGGSGVLSAVPGGEIAGVAIGDKGVYFTSSTYADDGSVTSAGLSLRTTGPARQIADLLTYEQTVNPDADAEYGFVGIADECAAQLPAEIGPPTYSGIVDSHPYAVATIRQTAYVADAAGNSILAVSPTGRVTTVAVIPPQPFEVTVEGAAALGLPECTVGLTYSFEGVPTDVEVDANGRLYVTTLPGGPEDPSLGARGSVYRIDPRTGATELIATGLAGATNLAVGPQGTIYVTELFAGRVSRIAGGVVTTHVELPSPAAIEYAFGRLYVGYDAFGDGAVATVTR